MSYFVLTALAKARRRCEAVDASGHGEVAGRNGTREFFYPTPEAVLAAAFEALQLEGLMLLLKAVGSAAKGLDGDELPLTFELFHEETGNVVTFTWTWPLANPQEYVGRHAARAATLTSAKKHFQLHLLDIRVNRVAVVAAAPTAETQASRDAAVAKAVGSMPGWASDRRPGPPADAEEYFAAWARAEFRRRLAADHLNSDPPTWRELVAWVLGGEPREVADDAEERQVCRHLAALVTELKRSAA